jgi:hypothetical protein
MGGVARNLARALLVAAGIVFLLTSSLLCIEGDPCYLVGYGLAFLLSLPALRWAGLLSRIVAVVLAVFSLWGFGCNLAAALDPAGGPMGAARRLQTLAYAKEIARIAAVKGYPADLPVATDKEYVERLVQNMVPEERDWMLRSFGRSGAIDFTIYRVSKDDPPDTVFLVLKPGIRKRGYVVVRKSGDGLGSPRPFSTLAPLPPRQPETLESVPPAPR